VTPPVATGDVPTREFRSVVPEGSGPFPLVVFLHGCTQTAADVEVGTKFSEAARARGVAVAYPEQVTFSGDLTAEYDGNDARCWNWFLEDHQHRGSGEPAALAAVVEQMAAAHPIDRRRIYVAGLSAGADMTAVMGATYPDLFAAVGVISGCAYATCTDVTGAAAYDEMQRAAQDAGVALDLMPAFIAQGSTDMVSNVALDQTSLRQWLATNDRIDDGELNGSVPPAPRDVLPHRPGGVAPPDDISGLCVAPNRFPCAGGVGIQGNYPYTVEYYDDAEGRPLIEHWLMHGLNHAYPNGDPAGSFTDPLGPDITNALLDFFLAHPKPAPDVIGPVPTTLEFTDASAVGGQHTDDVTLEARLSDAAGPLGGRSVTIGLAGEQRTVTTDGAGLASTTFTLSAEPGAHEATVVFAGEDRVLLPSEDEADFMIEREDTDLSLADAGKGANRELTAHLTDADTPTSGIRGRDVVFMADGLVIGTVPTDGGGVARMDVPPRYRGGQHSFTAAFSGDTFFLASEA
jgi:poly(hydroxyalkanoate) depolymerase family esterase